MTCRPYDHKGMRVLWRPLVTGAGSWNDDPAASGNVHSEMSSQTYHLGRSRAGYSPQTGRQHSEGETDESIIASEPLAIEAGEAVGAPKLAILPAAVFIIVEIILVAESISVILLKEIGPQHPGTAPIAMLLSMALLGNLGLVCGLAAASVAGSIRHLKQCPWPGSGTPAMPAGG
jgi:hypothetical protein